MAKKLATIGLMLRKQNEPDALATLQRAAHLDPTNGHTWKSIGHALAQDARPAYHPPVRAAVGDILLTNLSSG